MLAISTSCLSSGFDNGEALLNAIERFDVSALELEYRITEAMFQQMRKALKKSGLEVRSLHNYFPLPPIRPRSEASGDLFLLSSPDREERQRAVQWTTHTIEVANDLEARAIVLHCGRVEMDVGMDRLFDFLDKGEIESDEAQEFIRSKLSERDSKKPEYLDALLYSLDRLARVAESHSILLGLENRYFYTELPSAQDLELIFKEFDGGPLRYWHDTGHAHVNEALTITTQGDLLKSLSERLVGVHLHDARGREDHLPPGTGDVDFKLVHSYLKEDTLRVLELKLDTPVSEIAAGIGYLRGLGIG